MAASPGSRLRAPAVLPPAPLAFTYVNPFRPEQRIFVVAASPLSHATAVLTRDIIRGFRPSHVLSSRSPRWFLDDAPCTLEQYEAAFGPTPDEFSAGRRRLLLQQNEQQQQTVNRRADGDVSERLGPCWRPSSAYSSSSDKSEPDASDAEAEADAGARDDGGARSGRNRPHQPLTTALQPFVRPRRIRFDAGSMPPVGWYTGSNGPLFWLPWAPPVAAWVAYQEARLQGARFGVADFPVKSMSVSAGWRDRVRFWSVAVNALSALAFPFLKTITFVSDVLVWTGIGSRLCYFADAIDFWGPSGPWAGLSDERAKVMVNAVCSWSQEATGDIVAVVDYGLAFTVDLYLRRALAQASVEVAAGMARSRSVPQADQDLLTSAPSASLSRTSAAPSSSSSSNQHQNHLQSDCGDATPSELTLWGVMENEAYDEKDMMREDAIRVIKIPVVALGCLALIEVGLSAAFVSIGYAIRSLAAATAAA